jgi:alginate O-acetyltransferase complex protein AlgI
VFYAFWSPWFLLLIALSTSVDYFAGVLLPRVGAPAARRALLALRVGVNLGILIGFKYSVFLLQTAVSVAGLTSVALPRPSFSPFIPLGLSFYTFEAISYIVDVYRERIPPARNPLHYIDAFHLSAAGGVRFADLLAAEVMMPVWSEAARSTPTRRPTTD